MKRIPDVYRELNILKGWELVSEIGSGSFGKVFHVRQNSTGKEAALKWVHIDKTQSGSLASGDFVNAQSQLLAEIATMQNMAYVPEIVAIEDFGYQSSEDGNSMDAFIRMELLTPLLDKLNGQGLTVQQTAQLVQDVAKALHACHGAGIIHGDIKPENILCSSTGYKLGDFGVVLNALDPHNGNPRGTQYFQPPEYRQGHHASVQGDIYSLGMMLYIIFNDGMLPCQTSLGRQEEMKAWQRWCDLQLLPDSTYPVPKNAIPRVAAVITRAISFAKEQRYHSVQELARDYAAAIAGLTDAQRLMKLTYNSAAKELPASERVYLSTGRKTPGGNILLEAQENQSGSQQDALNATGFEIPKVREQHKDSSGITVQPSKPDSLEEKKISTGAIILGLAGVLGLLGLLIVLLQPPAQISYTLQTGRFGVDIQLENVGENASVHVVTRLANAQTIAEITTSGREIHLDNLAPTTEYEIVLESGGRTIKIPFTTETAASGRFQPLRQRVYTCQAHLLDKHDMAYLEEYFASEADNGLINLRDASLAEQNLAILFRCRAGIDTIVTNEPSTIYTVIRIPDAVVLVQAMGVPPQTLETNFSAVTDVSALLDAYYAHHGAMPTGPIKLELYWLDELVGSSELTLNTAGGS